MNTVFKDFASLTSVGASGQIVPRNSPAVTLGARGFSCAVRIFSLGFAARVFGLRPKTGRPAADEAPRRTREKNLWYPGYPAVAEAIFILVGSWQQGNNKLVFRISKVIRIK